MDKSYRSPLVLPKLKAKAELLQALPELRKYFPDAADLIPAERHRGATRRPAATAEDSDDEEKQAAKMKEELKRIKTERTFLLQSLAAARKKSHGLPAGDLQSQDIAALRTSLSEKQQVLNELRERNSELEQRIEALSLGSRDASLLVPEEGGGAAGEVGDRLAATLAEHESAAKEIETRTVQYQLLADRTTRDRDVSEHRMKLARELKEAAEDDLHTLSQHYYEMHAAKENAERELGVAVAQYDDSKTAWKRKLRDRRREMKAVERRLAEETAEQTQRTQQAALEAAQKTKEREAAQEQQYAAALEENNPAILGRLQEAETTWSRLRAVAGASSPEEIVAAWQDLRDRAQALQGLLAMTRRQEDQRREDLAELQQLQASSQITGRNYGAINDTTNRDDATGAKSEEKRMVEEQRLQKQQRLNRLESLCAAAELSLKGLLDRFNASQTSDSELWKMLRAQQQLEQQQQQRKSVVVSSGPGAAHPHRRASVLLPRRVSAVDLAHTRSAAAQNHNRRGSIEIPVDLPQQQQSHQQQLQKQQRTSVVYSIREGPISSLQEEEGICDSTPAFKTNNLLPNKTVFPACTGSATTTTSSKKNEFFSELPDAVVELAHHFDLLLSLEPPPSSTITNSSIENSVSVRAHTPERSTHSSMPSGYKRSTMVGPAWMENKSASPNKTKLLGSFGEREVAKQPEQEKSNEAARQSPLLALEGGVSPRTERQQAQHEAQAAERYMRRLVGATAQPAPEIEDPFALDSSDEDQRPFDRAALKHRSRKVTHPKQPKNVKRASKHSSPKPNRESPGGGLSLTLLSSK
ncbi:hypothetical protein Ndes2526B_g00400 [Nannochloris sp. 'desiccata']|nr:hypothetical protein NADE_002242 [Chlorella desiccata (nom. nud.)]